MKKIRKLTPATLKRIIAEEKYKMMTESQTKSDSADSKYAKLLNLLREEKNRKAKQIHRIDKIRRLIKQKVSKES